MLKCLILNPSQQSLHVKGMKRKMWVVLVLPRCGEQLGNGAAICVAVGSRPQAARTAVLQRRGSQEGTLELALVFCLRSSAAEVQGAESWQSLVVSQHREDTHWSSELLQRPANKGTGEERAAGGEGPSYIWGAQQGAAAARPRGEWQCQCLALLRETGFCLALVEHLAKQHFSHAVKHQDIHIPGIWTVYLRLALSEEYIQN